jgi:superfamily I DNA/RNA helicase/CRISPR/Cas system-associated exonuclease Cas4 (RecB family)
MLNKKYLEYITSGESNFLITGPPGSGKTYTLLRIIKYLIDVRRVEPDKILVLTFNRRWSKIIREQSTIKVGDSLWEIPIETFYSFCIDLLELSELYRLSDDSRREKNRKEGNLFAGFNQSGGLRILNSVEQWNLLKNIVKELDKNDYPGSYRCYNSTDHVACSFLQEVFDFILRAQENLLDPHMLLKRFTPELSPILSELSGIYARYTNELIENGSYNYGMLLLKTADILEKEPSIRRIFQKRYKYIIVDELQETNRAQFKIIELITRNNCIFFGNDDQAIYSFRGSSIDNFRRLYKDLDNEKRVFFLKRNYRSGSDIVRLSEMFINIISPQIPKASIPLSKSRKSGHVALKSFPSLLEEVNYICEKILILNRNFRIRPENIAIIIKGAGYETHLIEEALRQRKISFIRRSSRSLMENHYISYIINFLKLAAELNKRMAGAKKKKKRDIDYNILNNGQQKEDIIKIPHDNQDYLRINRLLEDILNSNIIDLDPLFYSKLKSSYSLIEDKSQISFLDYILENESKGQFQKKLSKIIKHIEYFTGKIGCDIFSYIMDLLNDPEIGIFRFLKDKRSSGPDIQSWICLGDFLKSVQEYTVKSTDKSVEAYLSYIENLEINRFLEEVEESTEEQSVPDTVNIISFHQCKGMEYDAVFIPFINDKYLPSEFKPPQIFDIRLFENAVTGSNLKYEDIEQEHFSGEVRLFYNGMTRARKYLYITSCKSRGDSVFFKKLRDIMKSMEKDEDFSLDGGVNKKNDFRENPCKNIYGDRDWRVKKRLLTTMVRLENGLKTEYRMFLKDIIMLNHLYNPKKWWNLNKNTANPHNPFEIFRRPFSYSGLEAYRSCPFRYMARYFYNIYGEEEFNLRLGKIYHNILLEFFNGKENSYTWERLEEIIDSSFEKQYFEFRPLKDEAISRTKSDMKRYYDNYLPENPKRSIMEKPFRIKLNGLMIGGRIDQINFLGDGRMEIVDFKSSQGPYSKNDLKEELQLKLYRFAVEGRIKDYGASGIIMKYINLGAEKNAEYFIPDNYYDSAEVEENIKSITSKILNEDFRNNPKNYMSCKDCEYKLICPGFYGNEY